MTPVMLIAHQDIAYTSGIFFRQKNHKIIVPIGTIIDIEENFFVNFSKL